MANTRGSRSSNFALGIKKFLLSAAVVLTFLAYGLQQHANNSDEVVVTPVKVSLETNGSSVVNASLRTSSKSPAQAAPTEVGPSAALPTQAPPTATPKGRYIDGKYTGNVVDAYYGLVQVQASIQGGQIADVQFLQYPTDRRTSQFINSQATPWLRTEALQAQSARVNIISGATLTSRAFIMSLDSALTQAAN